MSLIRRLLPGGNREERSGLPRGLPLWNVPNTRAGQVVTPETAARSAAVTACQRVLTTTVASLPVDVVRMSGNRRLPVTPTPPIVRSPSATVKRRAWVAQVMKSMTSAGNAYGLVTAHDGRGFPLSIETVHYRFVSWLATDSGLKPHLDGKEHDLWPLGDLVHIPASPFIQPGSPVADSPVELAKQSIGTGLAAEDFGARFFGDGYHPTVLAKSSQTITPEQAQAVKDRLNAMRHNREVGVFGSGWEFDFPEIKGDDSQFIDLMRFEVEQACRFFGVPPSMAYAAVSGQSVTYTNVSQADLQYLKHSVGIWMLDLEDAWASWLPSADVVKFNVDALLRMDAPERWKIHDLRLKNKTTSVNRVLALEDEEPVNDPEFDKFGVPGSDDDSRSLSAAEVSQKVYLAFQAGVLTRSEARQLIADAGAEIDPDAMPELAPTPTEAASVDVRSLAASLIPGFDVTIQNHMPPSERAETPVVNVAAPTVNVAAPNVTVENTVPVPSVTVERSDVHVASAVPDVVVNPILQPAAEPKTRRVVRDAKGNITKVVEEE